MNTFSILFLIFLTTFRQFAFAHVPSEGKVSATVVGLTAFMEQTNSAVRRPIFFGSGLIVEGDLSRSGGIELSLLYTANQYVMKKEGTLLVERVNRMYVPLGYRYWFSPKMSAGLGFFSSYKMGRIDEMHRSTNLPPEAKSSAHDTTEYGLDFSFGYEITAMKKYAITIDARYSWPVTEKQFEVANQYMFLVGIKYEVQRKEKAKKGNLK